MEKVRRHTDSFVKDEQVTVALEDCAETFSVSRALLCSASDYFRKALNNGFAETAERTLRLPGCDEETFRLFLYYMTTNALPAFDVEYRTTCKGEVSTLEKKRLNVQFQLALVRVWFFGDICLMPKLQNAAMDRLIDLLKEKCPAADAVKLAFATDPDGLLCKVFVKEAACDYIHSNAFKTTAMDELGAIPGFCYRFTDEILYCRGGRSDCKHQPTCTPSKTQDRRRFYVAVS